MDTVLQTRAAPSLSDDGCERVWRGLPVGLDHPGVVGARLEDELPPAGAARLQVDEGPDLRSPHVLRYEAVAPLQIVRFESLLD